jgi:hypothetical protein
MMFSMDGQDNQVNKEGRRRGENTLVTQNVPKTDFAMTAEKGTARLLLAKSALRRNFRAQLKVLGFGLIK